MKIKLIALILCIFLYGSLPGQTHKPGEKSTEFKFDCSTCHECDTPTRLDPCLKKCPRFYLITVHHSPEEGPDILYLNNFTADTDLYDPVIFTHRLHSEMSGMSGGCSMCHHYNPPGSVLACRNCHEIQRLRSDVSKPDLKGAFHRQCMDCHRIWSASFECESCHAGADSGSTIQRETIGRVHPHVEEPAKKIYQTDYDEGKYVTFYHNEHVNLYEYSCETCHTNENCARCHAEDETLRADLGFHESHEICSSCHDTEIECSVCHADKIKEPFNHARRSGFDLLHYHAESSCNQCHITKGVFTGLDGSCLSCHRDWTPDSFYHGITGLALDENHVENDCEDCHMNREFTAHPSCETCHDTDIVYPEYRPGEIKLSERR